MTCDIPKILHKSFGGTYQEFQSRRPNTRLTKIWEVSSNKAVDILVACRPYIRYKNDQIDLACDFQSRLKAVKLINKELPEEELIIREAMYNKMKELHKK